MMGSQALRLATQVAILSANYIAHKLKEHYAILYTGQNDMIAHECIIDIRPLKESIGIEVDDIAKRLVDFGFMHRQCHSRSWNSNDRTYRE